MKITPDAADQLPSIWRPAWTKNMMAQTVRAAAMNLEGERLDKHGQTSAPCLVVEGLAATIRMVNGK